MIPRSEVDRHRRDVAQLVAIAHNDLRLLVARQTGDAEQARDELIDFLPQLTAIYGAAAAALAADWYQDLREASGVRGRYVPDIAELPGTDRTDALARWAVGPLFQAEPEPDRVYLLAAGGMQRIIANADRETITTSSVNDRGAQGWTRSTSGPCDFCDKLAGPVYAAEVEFSSHDGCQCVAVPAL